MQVEEHVFRSYSEWEEDIRQINIRPLDKSSLKTLKQPIKTVHESAIFV